MECGCRCIWSCLILLRVYRIASEVRMLNIGIDIGSKTIKAVVLQGDLQQDDGLSICNKTLFAAYRPHDSNVAASLGSLLKELEDEFGTSAPCGLVFTGSGSMGLSKRAQLDYVQEVRALRLGAAHLRLDADAALEMGGEDSKIVYFGASPCQRMNTSCAGGTGSFLEDAAALLAADMGTLDELAGKGKALYPIASRCAVFALRDIKPLINSDAKQEDIAASVYASVVDQTLATLCAGRKLEGRVLFLGGPFKHLPNLVNAFAQALHLGEGNALVPPQAELVCAYGAAAASASCKIMTLGQIAKNALNFDCVVSKPMRAFPKLAPVDAGIDCYVTETSFKEAQYPLFVGFDLGSSSTKFAVLDSLGRLVFAKYDLSPSCPSLCAKNFWDELEGRLSAFGKTISNDVARVASCGYGESQISLFCNDFDVMAETAAHLRSAVELRPDASFVLDIGGQDMKAMWVQDGQLKDVAVNESCSSGCGAFVSSAAAALGVSLGDFDKLAFSSKAPVDLGTRCTVFMRSRIRQAQERGAGVADIAAGAAYAIAQNALIRLLGSKRAQTVGDVVVVQGGAFESDAVLSAFQMQLGKQVMRPAASCLMGAIGCALLAKDAHTESQSLAGTSLFAVNESIETVPNTAALQQQLLSAYRGVTGRGKRAGIKIGIVNALNDYESLPFWHACLSSLGFSIVVPQDCAERISRADVAQSLVSDTVCLPAQLAHKRLLQVAAAGATCAWCPSSDEAGMCAVTREYQEVLPRALSGVVDIPVLVPKLGNYSPRAMDRRLLHAESLRSCLEDILPPNDTLATKELEDAVRVGQQAYRSFVEQMEDAALKALDWVHRHPNRHAIVLSGRSYHIDAELLGGIDRVLQSEGFAVLAPLGVSKMARKARSPFLDHTVDRNRTWTPAKRVLGFAALSVLDPQLDTVFLQSFGCGMDAISHVDARRMLEKNNRPFTLFKIDSKSDERHVRIRVRALANAIKNRRAAELHGVLVQQETKSDVSEHGDAFLAGSRRSLPQLSIELAPLPNANQEVVPFLGLSDVDAKYALQHLPSDICSTVALLAAYGIRVATANPKSKIEIPLPCEGCVLESVQHFITLSGSDCIVEWVSNWPEKEPHFAASVSEDSKGRQRLTRIGICGNPLILFDEVANQGVVKFVCEAGVQPVFGDLYSWYSDVAHYVPQIESLEAKGVKHVLLLQSFMCLKGHVHMRGALDELKERFRDMSFSVIDLDLNASDLNIKNRVLLSLDQMLDSHLPDYVS